MKLINFSVRGRESFGAVGSRGIVDLGARMRASGAALTDALSLLHAGLVHEARSVLDGDHFDYGLGDVQIRKPVGRGLRYFCIGVNYPDRNEEYKDGSERPRYPSIFTRSHTSFSAHEEPVVRPRESEQLDYEGEIVIVIGQGGRRIPLSGAMQHVFAYTCANEGSVRDWLRHSKFNVTQERTSTGPDRSGHGSSRPTKSARSLCE